jgi:hypothetical protein
MKNFNQNSWFPGQDLKWNTWIQVTCITASDNLLSHLKNVCMNNDSPNISIKLDGGKNPSTVVLPDKCILLCHLHQVSRMLQLKQITLSILSISHYLDEGEFAADSAIGNTQFSILIYPALATKQIVHTSCYFVPLVPVTILGQMHIHTTCTDSVP